MGKDYFYKKYLDKMKQKELEAEYIPSERDLEYLNLKAQGKSRLEIIRAMHMISTYIERRQREYIIKRMKCTSINKAFIKAYKLGWIK